MTSPDPSAVSTTMTPRRSLAVPVGTPSFWYKDAIIYQVHVKAFADSNGDGIGDFPGLIGKLDYLQSLGVTALWLLPFYPSPLRDDGYDIADYSNVNPMYGTLADFRAFLKEAHARGLRVITELVINHTSDAHAWFQRARRAPAGSTERNFYVWSATADKYKEARIIFKDFEPSNWTWDPVAGAYFWHRFYHHQPDLNFDLPAVKKAIFRVFDFWLEMGVDGLRLDAIPYLFEREGTDCENLPETHAFLRELRARVDAKFPDAMLLAEANQWPEDAAAYFGNGASCHMAFHFPVMPRLFMALQMEDRFPIIDILDQTPAIPESCQWAIFLRNHDELTLEMVTDEERDYMYRVYATDPRARINLGIRRRLAPLLGNNRRKIELINILLLSLPGTPIIYYGDEIGMGDNIYLGDRNGVRTPMQWSVDRNAGFSRANPQQLYLPVIIDPEYHYEAISVENQERNLSSLLFWMRRTIALRRRYLAFGRGTIEFLPSDNPKVLTFVRRHGEEIILVVVNLSRFAQSLDLDLSAYAGLHVRELLSHNPFPPIRAGVAYSLTFGPHGHYWLSLEQADATLASPERPLPTLEGIDGWPALLSSATRSRLEKSILPAYLPTCRWFRSKGRRIQQVTMGSALPLAGHSAAGRLWWFEVRYGDGLPETYVLPLQFTFGESAERLLAEFPKSVLALCTREGDNGKGVVFDATFDPAFRAELLEFVASRGKTRDDARGYLMGLPSQAFPALSGGEECPSSRVLGLEQSNTSILYGKGLFLKLYRKLEEGDNPEIEVTRFLTERRAFPYVPPYGGLLSYSPGQGRQNQVIALLQGAVQNESDAWSLTLDAAARYYERVLAAHADAAPPAPPVTVSPRLLENDILQAPEEIRQLIGNIYPDRAALLGRRTGELHLALASDANDPAFAPEAFTLLYQRSLLQSMTSLARRVLTALKNSLPALEEPFRASAAALIERQREIASVPAVVLRAGQVLPAVKMRIHGDYHLGQVLFTGKDFAIIDFEGEPGRPLSERKLKRSPLADVAGMVRSFHYAAHATLLQKLSIVPETTAALRPWAEIWYGYVAGSFLRSYLATVAESSLVPVQPGTFTGLLAAFLLDKAIYELGYEINNRPAWVPIPLRGIFQVLESQAPLLPST